MGNGRKSERGELGSLIAGNQQAKGGRTVRIWTERVLLVSGLVLLALVGAARIERFLGARAALQSFAAIDSAVISVSGDRTHIANQIPHVDTPEVDFSLWDEVRMRAYKASLTEQSGFPLAVLRIAKLHLEVPLLDGTDDLTLNHAVGRIEGTARPGENGNIGIAGHRDGFFRGLKNIRTGDAIELKTLRGSDSYIVDQIKIVSPNDVSVLRPRSVPSLTLVTCYPFYFIGSAPQRYIVTASLTRETKSGSEKSESPSVISNMQINKEEQ